MNVSQLIEFLKTQDQGAEVVIVEHTSVDGHYEQGGRATETAFDKDTHVEYTDFRGNQFVKPEAKYYNKRYLLLGAMDA